MTPLGQRYALVTLLALSIMSASSASAAALRIVSYNIQADVDGVTTPRPGLDTVLEAIGEQNMNGVLQPLDILALQETTSNSTTVAPIVAALNDYYGTDAYALVAYQGTQHGNAAVGNGPNALLYNTTTVQLVLQNGAAAVGVPGTPNKNGVNRQVVRYEFQPVGGTADDIFFIYVSHMKSSSSGDESVNETDRNNEALLIRQDAATLPSWASILYVGDFNMSGPTEAAYGTLTGSGPGQGIDPVVWSTPTPRILMSESSTDLRYRDDIQFMTANVASTAPVAGLHYVAGSFRAFGNNGTTSIGGSVNSSSNTSLNNLVGPIAALSARAALVTASDHLPVVADYLFLTPYDAWREQNFTAQELSDPSISDNNADPDQDGISNAMEYALALDPNVPDASGLPKPGTIVVGQSSYLTLTYTRPINASDLTYTVEVSSDLVAWLSGSDNTVTVSTTNNPDGVTQTVVVRDGAAMDGVSQRFIRLNITGP